jgi:hypothetical protein
MESAYFSQDSRAYQRDLLIESSVLEDASKLYLQVGQEFAAF